MVSMQFQLCHVVWLLPIVTHFFTLCPSTLAECTRPNRVSYVKSTTDTFNNVKYTLVNEPKLSWNDAQKACKSNCGILTSIQSPAEKQFLIKLVEKSKPEQYIDMHALVGGYRTGANNEYKWLEGDKPIESFAWVDINPHQSPPVPYNYTTLCTIRKGITDEDMALDEESETPALVRPQIYNFICKEVPQSPFNNETDPDPDPEQSTTTQNPSPNFSCDGRECGRYPDDRNCSAFYICGANGTLTRETCDDGLHFNRNTSKCDLPMYADCAVPFSCDDKECGSYPDPNNCNGYYVCAEIVNGTSIMAATHRECPNGLEFNMDLQTCDIPMEGRCGFNFTG